MRGRQRLSGHRAVRRTVIVLVALLAACAASAQPSRTVARAHAAVSADVFIENTGQWSHDARYRLRAGDVSLWLAADAAWLDVAAGGHGHVLRHRFVGGRAQALVPSSEQAPWTFFDGSDRYSSRSFSEVTYRDIYPGIDARYYRDDAGLKYDVVVAPHAEIARLRMRYDGAASVTIADDGSLRIATSVGEVREARPASFQMIGGRRVAVSSSFVIDERGVGFSIGRYDRSRPLVIDPSLAFASYVGGGADDSGRGIAVDDAGNVYVAGTTHSSDVPTTPGAYSRQPDRANSLDLFVVKLDPTMSVLLYGTYLGGRGTDELAAIRVRSDGAVVLAGTTSSDDFPVTSLAEQRTLRGLSDGFVTILQPDGRSLRASTYFGGGGLDRIADLAISTRIEGEQPFVVGTTTSGDLPRTSGSAFERHAGGAVDAFVARFASDLSGNPTALRYATYLGGSGNDRATGIALALGGAANVTGSTTSTDFPTTPGATQSTNGGADDGFVARVRFNGTVLEYATYLGGSSIDRPLDIALDRRGNPYVTGLTFSTDYPVSTADAPGTWFITRIDSSTGSISTGSGYSRFIGPVHDGAAWTLQASATGEAFIAGSTNSAAFPTTPDALVRGPRGGLDLALVRLSADGSQILHSSVIGGEGEEVPWHQSHLTRLGDLYVTGRTISARFPVTENAFDPTLNNNGSTARSDAFALLFRFEARPTIQSPVRRAFDTVFCDTSMRDTFEVVNAGDAELVIRANIFSQASGRFILERPDPGNDDIRIAPGDRFRYIVRFRAPQPGAAVDTLLIYSNDSLRDPLRVALSGIRVSPAFQGVSPTYNIGTVDGCPGAVRERQILFANSGNIAARVTGARLVRNAQFRLIAPTLFPLTIGVGDAAPFTVRFQPSQAGSYSDTLVVSIEGCPTPVRVAVTGVADSVGLDIVESDVTFPPLAACIGGSDTTITIRSTGTSTIRVSLDAPPGSGFSVTSTLPITIPAGRQVLLAVRFAPAAGPATATAVLRLRTDDPCARVDSVVLSGERRPGAALQAPDTIRFGTLPLCAATIDSVMTVEIVNRSGSPVTVGLPTVAAPFALDNAPDFPMTADPATPVTLRLRFSPTAAGVSTALVALPIDASGCRDTLRIPMSGSAEPVVIAPSDTTIAIATLPQCVAADTVSVILRNLSGAPVEIDSVWSSDGVRHLAPALAFSISPGGSTEIFLEFAPRQSGPALERLVFYTRGCRDSIVVRLDGRKEGVVVVPLPSSIEIAPILACAIDTVIVLPVRVLNTGDFAVRVLAASIRGASDFSIIGDPRGATIAAKGELVVEVAYVPSGVGPVSGALELLLDPCDRLITVPLSASVVATTLSADVVDFGIVRAGSSSTASLVVRNELPVAVRIATIGPPPAAFAFVAPPALPVTLGAGETLRVAMRFDPALPGSYTPTMELAVDSSCGFVQYVTLRGTALAPTDTIEACISGREAGITGDIVELMISTSPHDPLGPGATIEYSIAYDWRRLEFIDAPGASRIGPIDPTAAIRLRLDAPTFGAQHLRLRFRVLSGDGVAAVRLEEAVVTGADVLVEPCADSASIRVSDRCVLTGVALGRYENRLEASRPNPARGSAEIRFQQLEDAHTILAIHDLEGRELLRAVDEPLAGGSYTVRVDLAGIAAGTYVVRIVAGAFTAGTIMRVE